MVQPVNKNNCCDLLSGPEKKWCPKDKTDPIVVRPEGVDIARWVEFSECRNTQISRHLMAWQFDGDMKKVAKAAQNVTKSNGLVAGALVLLVGTMAAAVDAVQLYDVLVSEYERKHGVIEKAPDAFSREDRIKDLIKVRGRSILDSIEKYLKPEVI